MYQNEEAVSTLLIARHGWTRGLDEDDHGADAPARGILVDDHDDEPCLDSVGIVTIGVTTKLRTIVFLAPAKNKTD